MNVTVTSRGGASAKVFNRDGQSNMTGTVSKSGGNPPLRNWDVLLKIT